MRKYKYSKYTTNREVMENNNRSRGCADTDKFHTGLLFGVLIMAYGLNYAFGFDVGTTPYGTLFSLAIAVWAVISVVDYFKED